MFFRKYLHISKKNTTFVKNIVLKRIFEHMFEIFVVPLRSNLF